MLVRSPVLALSLLAALLICSGPQGVAHAEESFPDPAARPDEAPPAGSVTEGAAAPRADAGAGDAGAGDGGEAAPGAGDAEDLRTIEDASGSPLQIDIVGARSIIGPDPEEAFKAIPGSGFVIDRKRLEQTRTPLSVQDSLRGRAGVNVRPEVNGGVVPNIGIRGLNPDRSEGLLILEDGVLVGFAPYTINAAYYVPPSERIARIELLKGSGQILYGPHTVGAVMNLITPEIPDGPRATVRLLGGSDGYLAPYVEAGTTRGAWGLLVTGLWKRGDGYREASQFDVRDAMVKLRRTWGRRTDVTLKGTFYEALTNNTYLGLTQGLYESDPYQNPARFDTYDVNYYAGGATFRHQPYTTQEYLVNVYVSSGRRDWNRQDFARNTGFAPPPANTVETVGDPTIDGGAIYMRESFGSRDRDFFKIGIEPRVHGEFWAGGTHVYDAGFRLHSEKYTNERNNRPSMNAPAVTRDRDVSRTHAVAAWVHDTYSVNRRFRISGGVRLEYYETERSFDQQGNLPVNFRGDTDTTVLIPGLGVTHDVGRGHTAFAGVHRGFAPPRTSDAIDSTGTDLDLDAEKSWNFELGMRGTPRPWFSYEVTAFYMDFENQVVPANESGGASTTDTNAGQTRHQGVEAAVSVELVQAFSRTRRHPSAPKLWFDASWTWLNAENVTPGGLYEGLDLPYAPEHMGSFGFRGQLPRYGVDLGFFASYTGQQFTDQVNTLAASADGTRGLMPSYWVLDATARVRVPGSKATAILSVNNLLDEVYISSRAPQGIFAGAPRHLFAGMEFDL